MHASARSRYIQVLGGVRKRWEPVHASALTKAQISEIETTDIRRKYASKQEPRPIRPKISTAKEAKEAAKAEKGAKRAGIKQGARGRMGWRGGAAIGAAEKVCLQAVASLIITRFW